METAETTPRKTAPRHPVVVVVTRIVVCTVVLATGIAIAVGLTLSAPVPEMLDQDGAATRVVAIEVETTPVARRWRGFGTAQALDMSLVPARVASTVAVIPADLAAGRKLDQGDLLAKLDDEDFRRQVAMNDESVSQLDSELERLRVQLGLLASRLELARREVDLAEQDLVRVRDARARGAALPREVDAAEQAVLTARRGLLLIEEIEGTLPARIRATEAERERLNSSRALAQSQVERCEIRAPYAGVVADLLIEVGEQVAPGMPVVRMFDPDRVEVPLRIPASARGEVAIGDVVLVARAGDAEPRTTRILRISPEDDPATRTMTVFADVHGLEAGFVPGTFLTGEIVASTQRLRSIVPRRAVRNQRVMLVEDGRIRMMPVTVAFPINGARPDSGLLDRQWLAIEEQLPPGTVVVVDGGREIETGTRVAPRAPVVSDPGS